MTFNLVRLSQQDPRWKNVKLGFSSTSTIGEYGCAMTSVEDYLAAVEGDPEFEVTRARAEQLGYDPVPQLPVVCELPTGPPMHIAVLSKPNDETDFVVLRSWGGLASPFKTLAYRNLSASQSQMLLPHGTVSLITDDTPTVEDMSVLNLEGQTVTGPPSTDPAVLGDCRLGVGENLKCTAQEIAKIKRCLDDVRDCKNKCQALVQVHPKLPMVCTVTCIALKETVGSGSCRSAWDSVECFFPHAAPCQTDRRICRE